MRGVCRVADRAIRVLAALLLLAHCGGGGGSASTPAPVPAAPTGLTAVAGDAQVQLHWMAVSGSTSYNVYYGNAAGVTTANGTRKAGLDSGGTVTGLNNGTTYYFVLTAVNVNGESAPSGEVSALPAPAPVRAPAAPTGLTATAGDKQAQLGWTAVSGASGYNVYYRSQSGVTAANGTRDAVSAPADVVTGLTNGTRAYFVVTAVNAGGESPVSNETSVTPAAPTGSWTTRTPMVNPRDNAANVVQGGRIYVMGGAPAGISILDSMERYDPALDTSLPSPLAWTTLAPLPAWSTFPIVPPGGTTAAPPAYRYAPAAAPAGGLIYLIGGTSLVSGDGPIYPTAVYDPVADAWSSRVPTTAATTMAGTANQALAPFPTGRWGFDLAVVDGLIYAVGGAVHVPGNITTTSATKLAGVTSGVAIPALSNYQHYYFFVTAVNGSGVESAPSYSVSALLRGASAAGEGTVAGNGQAGVTWMSVAGATSYRLYYSTKPGVMPSGSPNPTIVTGIAATQPTVSATVNGLVNGTPYYFIATALTPAGEVMATARELGVTPRPAPGAGVPTGVGVTAGNGQASVTWTPVMGATSYNVYYDTGTNFYYGNVDVYDPVANTWTARSPMPTPRWGATVAVINGMIYAIGGWGGYPELALIEIYDPATDQWSTTVPTGPATTAAGTAGAALAPMPTARDDFGYSVVNGIVYAIGGDTGTFDNASRTPCCTAAVEAYDPVTNTWTTKAPALTIRDDFDASVVDGVIYAIAGSRDGIFTTPPAVDPAIQGGYSLTTVEAYRTSSIPVPRALSATLVGATQAALGWSAVAGASSYNIYGSNKAGVATNIGTKIGGVTATSFTHSGLASGWYYYIVTAVTAAGESLPSNEVAVKR